MYTIRVALRDEAPLLSEIAFRSKSHWGYGPEYMEKFRAELKINPADFDSGLTKVVLADSEPIGFYSLYGEGQGAGRLTDLFVEPAFIGKGVGRRLWDAAIDQARRLGFKTLEIHSDPHAEGFYVRMGASRIGMVPSGSIPGRELPKMIMRVKD